MKNLANCRNKWKQNLALFCGYAVLVGALVLIGPNVDHGYSAPAGPPGGLDVTVTNPDTEPVPVEVQHELFQKCLSGAAGTIGTGQDLFLGFIDIPDGKRFIIENGSLWINAAPSFELINISIKFEGSYEGGACTGAISGVSTNTKNTSNNIYATNNTAKMYFDSEESSANDITVFALFDNEGGSGGLINAANAMITGHLVDIPNG